MGEDIPGPIVEDDDDAISTSSTLRDEKEASWQPTWQRYRGMSFVLLSEMFGACMIATARMLQNGTEERPGMSLPQVCQLTSQPIFSIDASSDTVHTIQHNTDIQHIVHVVHPSI